MTMELANLCSVLIDMAKEEMDAREECVFLFAGGDQRTVQGSYGDLESLISGMITNYMTILKRVPEELRDVTVEATCETIRRTYEKMAEEEPDDA